MQLGEKKNYFSQNSKHFLFEGVESPFQTVSEYHFTPREILDIMEFRLGGLYLQEMRDLRGGGATLAEVVKHSLKDENDDRNCANFNFE